MDMHVQKVAAITIFGIDLEPAAPLCEAPYRLSWRSPGTSVPMIVEGITNRCALQIAARVRERGLDAAPLIEAQVPRRARQKLT